MAAADYPWYEIPDGDDLEQGDLLLGCPVVLPKYQVTETAVQVLDNFEIGAFDVVVMTQSCDLGNDKVKDIIVCPFWSIDKWKELSPSMKQKNSFKQIKQGRQTRYTLLEKCELPDCPMDVQMVDLGRVFSLPKPVVEGLARLQKPRLRLRSPYKENLSQAFARFFMRVGLPLDIELPENA